MTFYFTIWALICVAIANDFFDIELSRPTYDAPVANLEHPAALRSLTSTNTSLLALQPQRLSSCAYAGYSPCNSCKPSKSSARGAVLMPYLDNFCCPTGGICCPTTCFVPAIAGSGGRCCNAGNACESNVGHSLQLSYNGSARTLHVPLGVQSLLTHRKGAMLRRRMHPRRGSVLRRWRIL